MLGLEAEDGGDRRVPEGVCHLFDQRSIYSTNLSIYSTKATPSCLLGLEAEDGGDGRVAEGVGHGLRRSVRGYLSVSVMSYSSRSVMGYIAAI